MYNIGVFPGKFFPPHSGHLNAIIQAATQVNFLYVVVSDNMELADEVCKREMIKPIPLKLRAKWLSIELQNIDHIKVIIVDETGIAPYPDGCVDWAKKLQETVPDKFDVIFGGEQEYRDTYMKCMTDVAYEVYDYERTAYPISATKIRNDYLKHWDYILGSAREFFARRVLLTGTESCGKTTMTRYLAKIFHTSWSEEEGRYYSDKYLGGNDKLLCNKDFFRIAFEQQIVDEHTLCTANRIAFFDTDAVVTQYYCKMYTDKYNKDIEKFVDPDKYDVVLVFTPTVSWVPDGMRWKSDDNERLKLHKRLVEMYEIRNFERIIIIDGNGSYNTRLQSSIEIANKLLADRHYMSR